MQLMHNGIAQRHFQRSFKIAHGDKQRFRLVIVFGIKSRQAAQLRLAGNKLVSFILEDDAIRAILTYSAQSSRAEITFAAGGIGERRKLRAFIKGGHGYSMKFGQKIHRLIRKCCAPICVIERIALCRVGRNLQNKAESSVVRQVEKAFFS